MRSGLHCTFSFLSTRLSPLQLLDPPHPPSASQSYPTSATVFLGFAVHHLPAFPYSPIPGTRHHWPASGLPLAVTSVSI
ncbi:hypothetical protein EV356DRAFT_508046 [Viridothelium virens]|uniref:Uncharacterized protein n=1 Tax=Viridothelium virens TaxID=1048519 RepID=A0A6A6GZ46_VIRVR|nr:hypothetical protein EV356DRAFT_508046 [Viridothelium virens]